MLLLLALGLSQEAIDFDALTKMADAYQLPAPPNEAKKVLAFTETWTILGKSSNDLDPGIYRPGFLLDTLKDGYARVLMGWEEKEIRPYGEYTPATRPYSLDPPEPAPKGYALVIAELRGVVSAVQLARRGESEDAKKIWAQILQAEYFHDGDALENILSLRGTPRALFARSLYQWMYHDTLREGADLRALHERLVRLRQDFPSLFNDGFHEARRGRFIDDLGRTVSAEKAPDGSVEAFLIAWGDRGGLDPTKDEAARRILLLGPKAIPELKRMRGDTRLTRRVSHAVMKQPEDRVRLGQLAGMLLEAIGETKAIDDKTHHETIAIQVRDGKIESFSESALWVLGQKYPRSLVELCARVPAELSPKTESYTLAKAVYESTLSAEDKAATLEGLCVRLADDSRVRGPLLIYAQVDSKKCATLLRPLLARLPEDVDGPYWTSEPARLNRVVMRLSDDAVWEDYLKAAKKAAVGLRMEMMNAMDYAYLGDTNRARRLAFLAAFLDDPGVRVRSSDPQRFDGPCAGFTFSTLSVRDFATMKIGSLLDVEGHPSEYWTPDEWTAYRTRVRAALEKEGIR